MQQTGTDCRVRQHVAVDAQTSLKPSPPCAQLVWLVSPPPCLPPFLPPTSLLPRLPSTSLPACLTPCHPLCLSVPPSNALKPASCLQRAPAGPPHLASPCRHQTHSLTSCSNTAQTDCQTAPPCTCRGSDLQTLCLRSWQPTLLYPGGGLGWGGHHTLQQQQQQQH